MRWPAVFYHSVEFETLNDEILIWGFFGQAMSWNSDGIPEVLFLYPLRNNLYFIILYLEDKVFLCFSCNVLYLMPLPPFFSPSVLFLPHPLFFCFFLISFLNPVLLHYPYLQDRLLCPLLFPNPLLLRCMDECPALRTHTLAFSWWTPPRQKGAWPGSARIHWAEGKVPTQPSTARAVLTVE